MLFFFFNDTATTEIYSLSLHDAIPISTGDVRGARHRALSRRGDDERARRLPQAASRVLSRRHRPRGMRDRKSTRLNSSHANISYAVFCLKKKNHNKESAQHHEALQPNS